MSRNAIETENARLAAENRRLQRRLKKAVEALGHYADKRNYSIDGVVTDGSRFGYEHPDRGAFARETLTQINQENRNT